MHTDVLVSDSVTRRKQQNTNCLRRRRYVRGAISHLDKESRTTFFSFLILPPRCMFDDNSWIGSLVNIKGFPALVCLHLCRRQTGVSRQQNGSPLPATHTLLCLQNLLRCQCPGLRLGGRETSVSRVTSSPGF